MRVNVYHHEIAIMADRVEQVSTLADTGNKFFGLRFPTEPPRMHAPDDDDSSAITLWMPWSRSRDHDTSDMRRIGQSILDWCDEIDNVPR